MKILSTRQLQELDQYTIENEPISSIDLMERASTVCAELIQKTFFGNNSFAVFCGIGNNGGDGMAIARILYQNGQNVRIYLLGNPSKGSKDFLVNFNRIDKNKIPIHPIHSIIDFPILSENEIVIDSIFGTGLNRPIEGIHKEIIKKINSLSCKVVSIDIPSGLFGENNVGNDREAIVQSDYTISFQQPKLCFLLSDFGYFAENWQVIDIGLSLKFIEKAQTNFHLLTKKDVQIKFKPRGKFSHKGTFGHALIIAGSIGKMGASILSTKAALRSGAGLVSTFVPKCGIDIMQITNPEAICELSLDENYLSGNLTWENYSSIGIGPGIGKETKTGQLINNLFENFRGPLVLDADALNQISENNSLFNKIPENSILTPHPKEFDRLFGKSDSAWTRLNKQIIQAKLLKCYIILKGTYTSICCPNGNVYFNNTGNTGLSKGGSGDVLTGLIAGLLAQGYSPKDACVMGVWIHGLSGDLASMKKNEITTTALDTIDCFSDAFEKIFQ
jgi:NAD(P)H-hydrate epimerase